MGSFLKVEQSDRIVFQCPHTRYCISKKRSAKIRQISLEAIAEAELFLDGEDVLAVFFVGFDEVFDGAAGVDDGGVVAVAQEFADLFEGVLGKFFREVHDELAGFDDGALAGFAFDVLEWYVEVVADQAGDALNGDDFLALDFVVL